MTAREKEIRDVFAAIGEELTEKQLADLIFLDDLFTAQGQFNFLDSVLKLVSRESLERIKGLGVKLDETNH